jgi:hypothetical protein
VDEQAERYRAAFLKANDACAAREVEIEMLRSKVARLEAQLADEAENGPAA